MIHAAIQYRMLLCRALSIQTSEGGRDFDCLCIEQMAVFLVQIFVKRIQIRVARVCSLPNLNNSIRTRLSFSTQVSVEETADEILNQILASGNDTSPSREELCLGHMRKLCAGENLQAAAMLPQILRGKHIFLGPRAYNCILEAAERQNDIDISSQIFKDLLVSCGFIGLNSYLILARVFGKLNNPALLLNFIKEVCEMELPRVDIVLNRFIYALAKCGHSSDALLVFDNMKSMGCKPDLVTYNTVLVILGRLGRVDDMLHVFATMRTADLIPDIITYNTVLNSLRKMGRLDLCLVHFKEMTERGIQPDLLTFKALIESFGRSGILKKPLKIFDEIKHMGIQPSIHIYRALIFCLKKMGKMELAFKFSSEMNSLLPGAVIPRDARCKNK